MSSLKGVEPRRIRRGDQQLTAVRSTSGMSSRRLTTAIGGTGASPSRARRSASTSSVAYGLVALRTRRPGADDDHVGQRPQQREDAGVDVAAERSGLAALVVRRTVQRGHEVGAYPGACRRRDRRTAARAQPAPESFMHRMCAVRHTPDHGQDPGRAARRLRHDQARRLRLSRHDRFRRRQGRLREVDDAARRGAQRAAGAAVRQRDSPRPATPRCSCCCRAWTRPARAASSDTPPDSSIRRDCRSTRSRSRPRRSSSTTSSGASRSACRRRARSASSTVRSTRTC